MNNFEEYELFVEAREKCYSCSLNTACETCEYGKIHEQSHYYKGEILPFIHYNCRKNMTSGDIDGFIYDWKMKRYMFIEQKWISEEKKVNYNFSPQEEHLKFLVKLMEEAKKSDYFKDWDFGVYKITGDPPFHECTIIRYPDKKVKEIDRNTLKNFLEFGISFDDIGEKDREKCEAEKRWGEEEIEEYLEGEI